ncbi:hypothetical protein BGP_1294 [Beggiatoa sp. PS]|nr:hypothetical protein BGP_1294 [Beggiatoa sp. PS]
MIGRLIKIISNSVLCFIVCDLKDRKYKKLAKRMKCRQITNRFLPDRVLIFHHNSLKSLFLPLLVQSVIGQKGPCDTSVNLKVQKHGVILMLI